MRQFVVFSLLLLFNCTEKPDKQETTALSSGSEKQLFSAGPVYADTDYPGARLNGFMKVNDTTYRATISPESTPTNNSPWFGFRIWSENDLNIKLEIVYTDGYKHRYIPKLSADGNSWKTIEKKNYIIDTIQGNTVLDLRLTSNKLWVSAQENINVESIIAWVDSLSKNDIIQKEIIGTSVQGRPLHLLRIHPGTSKRAIILIGRQHPPEVPGGTLSLQHFVHTLLSPSALAKAFREKFEIIVIPLLNPDGVNAGNWRFNANGKDLNRDWVEFSQPETSAVKKWVSTATDSFKNNKISYGIDFHTSYSGPYLLTLDTISNTMKPIITSKWIQNIEELTGDTLDIRPRSQTLPYCYNWLINEVGTEAVTYEEGDEIDRNIIKQRAENYANSLMKTLLEEDNKK